MELNGVSAVVTGGSRGIGPHIARALLTRGANVTIAARSADDLAEVKTLLSSAGPVATVAADITDSKGRQKILKAAEKAFGPVDVLVNNAGMEIVGRFTEYTEDEIRSIVTTNLESTIQLTRLAVPGMLDRKRGHVVNISSLAGKAIVPYNTVYSATKHALVGFSLGLRLELDDTGVGVSVVCPGYVMEAGMFARHDSSKPRAGTATTPEKVAKAVVQAIERNRPEVLASGFLPRLSDVVLAISPRATAFLTKRSGGLKPFVRTIKEKGKADSRKTHESATRPPRGARASSEPRGGRGSEARGGRRAPERR